MTVDLIIRGGTVVDGTGGPSRRADVAVKEGRIVALGEVDEKASRVVDAEGRVVAPGFVDVHTHYDAQVFWDPTLSPSPLHGVTTVIGGNCGFTIAPLASDHADYLMRMLARVEGMPLQSLTAGVPWDWKSTAEYLDRIDGTLAVNAGFMVGHSAVRRVVMGEDAVKGPATPEQLDAMLALFRQGLEAGGLGFSSSWARTHNDADGNMVPSRYASEEELIAFCRVTGEHPGTSLEFIPNIGPFGDAELELMAAMSAAANRQLNWNLLTVTAKNLHDSKEKLRAGDYARERGGRVVALTIPMSVGIRLSFASGFVLDALPGWEKAMALPPAEKLALLADPAERQRLDELAQQDGPMRGIAHWATKTITETFTEETKRYEGRTVEAIAEEEGKRPFDALLDIVLADELRTAFSPPVADDSDDDWRARVEVWRDDRAVIGASDAGAHLDLLATFNYTTVMLGEAVRARRLMPIEEAVHLLTDVPARLYGLKERGRLAEGWRADIVVLDPHAIGSGPVHTRNDLPAGAARVYAEATGVEHVIVNGEEIVEAGRFTDARPGTLLRSGRDTETVPAR